jgi:hypothetical protein
VTPPAGLRTAARRSAWPALGCVVLFLIPFAAAGLYAAVMAVRAARSGDWGQTGFLTIFVLTFGGVGIGGIAVVLAGRRRVEDAYAREASHPDAPWLWREDWASRRITDSSRSEMWSAWAFAALWNLVSMPGAFFGVRAALDQHNYAALLALVFPAVGIGLLAWAVRATLRFRRYGMSRLELATLPAVVGHSLEGTVRTPQGLRPAGGFRVVLSGLRRVTTGSGRNRSTSETIFWQEERSVAGGAAGVPVAFAIPADVAPTVMQPGGDRTLWRLAISAETPGVDYAATFEVPVFRTAGSEQPRTEAERAIAAATAVPPGYRQPAGSKIQVTTTRRGTEIYFPRARNPAMAMGLTAFLGLWAAAIWGTLVFHAPLIFPVVFGAFGLLLVVMVLDQWLAVTRVTVGDGAVTVANGWLAPRRERTLGAAEVAEVTTRIGSQAAGALYYDLTIVTKAGKGVAAGAGIRDKREAEWLAATITSALTAR